MISNTKILSVPGPRSGTFGPVTAPPLRKWSSPDNCGLSGYICEVGHDDCERVLRGQAAVVRSRLQRVLQGLIPGRSARSGFDDSRPQ